MKFNTTIRAILIAIVFMGILFTQNRALASNKNWKALLDEKINQGYSVETYNELEILSEKRVEKRKEIESLLKTSHDAMPTSFNTVRLLGEKKLDNASKLNQEILQKQQQKKKVLSNISEFKYVAHSDGSKSYSKSGQASSVENQRTVDQFGKVSYKTMYDMKYDDKNMLISYEADMVDDLGNITHVFWFGAKYSEDSVWYADDETSANKNIIEYYTKEIDASGNTTETHWTALNYDGKLVTDFFQEQNHSLYGESFFSRHNIAYINADQVLSYYEQGIGQDGLNYTVERTESSYNDKDLLTAYSEIKNLTNIDGSISTTRTNAELDYLHIAHQFGRDLEDNADPDRMLSSKITTITGNEDGSEKEETVFTNFEYGNDNNLVTASGSTVFSGKESSWIQHVYTDALGQEHILSTEIDEMAGETVYSYKDDYTLETIVISEYDVVAVSKSGTCYSGNSSIDYELVYGEAMQSEVSLDISYFLPETLEAIRNETTETKYINGLVNNIRRLFTTQETSQIMLSKVDPNGTQENETKQMLTSYTYQDNGNILDVSGEGNGSKYINSDDGSWASYETIFSILYDVILGKPVVTETIAEELAIL